TVQILVIGIVQTKEGRLIMFNRFEPPHKFLAKIANWDIDEIWEEYHSNKEAIFFYELELREFPNLSHPLAQEIIAWKTEFEEDNVIMLEEIDSRLKVEFIPWLQMVFAEYTRGGVWSHGQN